MPPIYLHLGIAEEAISRLRHPVVDENLGSYYLGSTAPDIRFFIGASREKTHFLSLDSEEGESGVKAMFEAYPELVEEANLSAATKSFIAGYISHLVTDEVWLYRIYRPFFGKSSPLGGDHMANLLDRVLQFELDRRERLNNENLPTTHAELTEMASGVAVSFIDASILKRWCEFVSIATSVKPGWDDFRTFAQKYFIWMRYVPAERIEIFFTSFGTRLEQVLRIIPEERLREFREQSIADSVRVAKEYLG